MDKAGIDLPIEGTIWEGHTSKAADHVQDSQLIDCRKCKMISMKIFYHHYCWEC